MAGSCGAGLWEPGSASGVFSEGARDGAGFDREVLMLGHEVVGGVCHSVLVRALAGGGAHVRSVEPGAKVEWREVAAGSWHWVAECHTQHHADGQNAPLLKIFPKSVAGSAVLEPESVAGTAVPRGEGVDYGREIGRASCRERV